MQITNLYHAKNNVIKELNNRITELKLEIENINAVGRYPYISKTLKRNMVKSFNNAINRVNEVKALVQSELESINDY